MVVFFGVWNADVLKAPNIILCLKEGVQTFALECKLGVVVFFGYMYVFPGETLLRVRLIHACVRAREWFPLSIVQ